MMGNSGKTRRIAIFSDSPTRFYNPENVSLPTLRYIEERAIPDIETAHEVVVGRYYRVPCTLDGYVDWREPRRLNVVVPILGPLHEDRKFIRFPQQHWHIDWRFVTALFMESRLESYREQTRDGPYYQSFTQPLVSVIAPNLIPIHRRPHSHPAFAGGKMVIRRTLRCKRLFAEFPADAFWIPELELAMRDNVVCDNICPHRGISLKGVESTDGMTVVCPGHGLRWDKASGRMVSRGAERLSAR